MRFKYVGLNFNIGVMKILDIIHDLKLNSKLTTNFMFLVIARLLATATKWEDRNGQP